MRQFVQILLLLLGSTLFSCLNAHEPAGIVNGLAVYRIGEGEPALLMPYPHASACHSMSESELVQILNDFGYSVLTFDPPGIYYSERKPDVTLDEMISCSNELLDFFNVTDSILLVGHSQSGFCSLAYAIECPEKVKKMVLIGSVSGWPMVRKFSIHKQFTWFTRYKWQILYLGTRKMLNKSNLLIHKKLDQLVLNKSYVDKSRIEIIPIDIDDKYRPEPIRSAWMINLRKYNYDYSKRLYEISVPVLVCVGRHDPQTPVIVNMQLANGIKTSEIRIFEKSGHSPFIEEKEEFVLTFEEWNK